MQVAPKASCVIHDASCTFTTNQPSVAGATPAYDSDSSSRASSTISAPLRRDLRVSGLLSGRALWMAGEAVVGELLPRRGVRDVLVPLRPDARIPVDRTEANSRVVGRPGRSTEERRAASDAEDLLETARRRPRPQLLFTGDDADAAWLHATACRRRSPGPALAAGAVAVGRRDERRRHLEADGAAAAGAGQARTHGLQPSGTRPSTAAAPRPPSFQGSPELGRRPLPALNRIEPRVTVRAAQGPPSRL